MKRLLALFILLVPCFAENAPPLLFRSPALGKARIVFSYAGDLWSVPREGGDAMRLTAGPGIEANPVFSPDGADVAFSGEYEGNVDVYVVSAEGGVPRRLTYHPSPDVPVAWTPDGKSILFRSDRESYSHFSKLFSVPAQGGFPESLPLPSGFSGVFSPDQARLAYMPITPANTIWKHYRDGSFGQPRDLFDFRVTQALQMEQDDLAVNLRKASDAFDQQSMPFIGQCFRLRVGS